MSISDDPCPNCQYSECWTILAMGEAGTIFRCDQCGRQYREEVS